VLIAADRIRFPLMIVPLLWCAISGVTLSAMDAPDAAVMPAVAVLAICGAGWSLFTARRRG
jgi:hypothetical protein